MDVVDCPWNPSSLELPPQCIYIHAKYELFLASLSVLQLAVLSAIYGTLLTIARKKTKSDQRMSRVQSHTFLRKSVLGTFVIVCMFYAVFLPYIIYRIYSTVDKSVTRHDKRVAWRWLIAFTFVNSSLNPFVYFFAMRTNRQRFSRRFYATCRREKSRRVRHISYVATYQQESCNIAPSAPVLALLNEQ